MLELHNISVGDRIRGLSLTVNDGQMTCISGEKGSGKTTLLRAVLGFLPLDGGHISIDGELLTPRSARYFRRQMAYVPQHLSVPDGYTAVPTDYLQLLERAVRSEKMLLIVDEPSEVVTPEKAEAIEQLLAEATQRGATVLAITLRNATLLPSGGRTPSPNTQHLTL
jgi:ABC-type Mn2+/Zn2+ transport system ATPase subunit